MSLLLLLTATALALLADAPWWLTGGLAVPTLLWAPGAGWARWLARSAPDRSSGLQLVIDACWLSAAATWIDVALVRELGLRGEPAAWALLGLALAWGLPGAWLARGLPRPATPRPERLGAAAVVLAVLLSALWRQADLLRPLDGYWWLAGAADEGHEVLPLAPAQPWRAQAHTLGWPEAHAWSIPLTDGAAPPDTQATPQAVRITAQDAAAGRIVLVVRGPLGSSLAVNQQRVEVEASTQEEGEERPVRRYLASGAAALATQVDLDAGEELVVQVQGERLYLLPGTEAVWAAHAEGELRYTHYWQILNQVENLDWAAEVLDWRWFTLNQPPGWSPLLATTLLFAQPDLPGNNLLFLGVLLLVGLSGLRLGSVLAPDAPPPAWLVPAGLVAVHALLMFEPGSTNFPDSLYAASAVGVALTLATRRAGAFALMGIAAGLLRWPGVVLATIMALCWWRTGHGRPWKGLARLWALVGLGALGAALIVAFGGLEDMLFILYFETFPEHWHGDFSPGSLLPRIPDFYLVWLRYTGGAWLLAIPLLIGASSPARRGGRFVLLSALLYSTLLCTIDHHPTHYFLPLVALCGPLTMAAAASARHQALRWGFPLVVLIGLWTTLSIGQVF